MFDERSTANRFKNTIERGQYANGRYMYTGKRQSDGSITLSGAAANKVWVRAEEDSREETQVWGTAQKVNLRVWVQPNAAGELSIREPDYGASAYGGQEGIAGSLLPAITPENVPNAVFDGRQFRPGRMRYSALGGLYVYIEGFHYPGGYWPGGDFEMTAPSTASKQAWCAVALNPADGTLSQVTGTEYALPVIMTSSEAGEITFTNGYIPCGAIVLYNGQTEITGSEKIDDLRYHFGQAGGDITGFVVLAPSSDTQNTIQPSGDHPALILKNNASQTDAPFQVQTSAGAVMAQVSSVGGLTVNEQGADADTRIEGDTDANLVFVDASTDRVGIGTNAPAQLLDVDGTAIIQTLMTDASTELTIASGAVTVTQTFHRIDTEADAASDDLDTINSGTAGQLLLIRAENTARTVVLKHNTGNILLFGAADVELDEIFKLVLLAYDGDQSKWVQVGGSGGGGGSFTVEDADASPSYSNVTKLIFDAGTVTQPAANQARITFPATAGSLITTTSNRYTATKLYDNTLGSNGSWDVQNSDLISGVGNFADYDYLELRLYTLVSTAAATADILYLLYGTGGGALDTTATNYSNQSLAGTGTTVSTVRADSPIIAELAGASSTANYVTDLTVTIFNPGSAKNKTALAVLGNRRDTTNQIARSYAHQWENTGTITRVGLRTDNHATDLLATGGRVVIVGYKTEAIITAIQGALTQATVQTTNNTATTLASVTVNEGEAVTVVATVAGAKSDYSAAIGGTITTVARRASGGNVTQVGSVTTNVQEDSGSSPTFTADVDTGTQTVRIRVTGITSETWNWRCTYELLREDT